MELSLGCQGKVELLGQSPQLAVDLLVWLLSQVGVRKLLQDQPLHLPNSVWGNARRRSRTIGKSVQDARSLRVEVLLQQLVGAQLEVKGVPNPDDVEDPLALLQPLSEARIQIHVL